jgi:hypothetical protein
MSDGDEKSEDEASKIDVNDKKAEDNSTHHHVTAAMTLLDLCIPNKSALKTHRSSIALLWSPDPINTVNEDDTKKYVEVSKGVKNYVPPPSQPSLLIEENHLNISNLHKLFFDNELEILFTIPSSWIAKFQAILLLRQIMMCYGYWGRSLLTFVK